MLTSDVHANQFVRLDFNLGLSRARGSVFIELFDDRPLTRDNFMQYVNGGHYDGSLMHRLSRDFVLQGGGFYPEFVVESPPLNQSLDPDARLDLDGNPATPNPTVLNEYNNAPPRSNVRGAIAMHKLDGQPDSATNQWFVNLSNNQELDTSNGGFTVFGRVLSDGMLLFDAYNELPIVNLNPDLDDDGVRDSDYPFFMNSNDGVPVLNGVENDVLLVLEDAERVDYFGGGSSTHIPASGLTISARDAFIDTGAVFSGSGPLTIGASRTLGLREGFSLNRAIINEGTLAPGLQLGSITVQNYRQEVGGALEIQIGGTLPDVTYDRLVVTGGALLGGRLNVSTIAGFDPIAGNSFTVLLAGLIVDSFSNISLPALSPGLQWNTLQTNTSLTLSVASADYNDDGQVDSADYAAWSISFGDSGTNLPADGNGNNRVDGGDFLFWQRNFGQTIAGASGAPEPGSAALAAMGAGALADLRRRRVRQLA
jgi:cyclophilin family peptidyl-prolyl cis-trans isomerase